MSGNSNKDNAVMVAMSGGVDSSVALLRLKERGFRVSGATMKLWDYEDVGGSPSHQGCCDLNAINDARAVCDALDVPHYVFDFTERFRETIIRDFVDEYLHGRTPNPCILCNTLIKWEMFLSRAVELGHTAIATGHYARTGYDNASDRFYLKRGVDPTRDQSYVLWGLSQDALRRTLFPLGDITKDETRRIAAEAGLKTARVAESREICFVADDDYERFIRERSAETIASGDIVDESGNVIGSHKGIPFYTIGQRRGLGIAHPTPLYVKRINVENRQLVVGEKDDLATREMNIGRANWVSAGPISKQFDATVQIRYQHTASPARVTPGGTDRLHVLFESPQWAITPGQSAVVYDGETVVAGGIIE
jgi:tRNA-specific 2-thiouridylase